MQEVTKKVKGKLYRTTRGYFGKLPVKTVQVLERDPVDGSKKFSRALRLPVMRIGVEKDTREAVGILDTRKVSDAVKHDAMLIYGEDNWHEELIKAVDKIAPTYGLVEINSKSEIKLYAKGGSGPDIIHGGRTVRAIKPALTEE